MHVDLEQVPESASFRATVCIIGGGIAGLLLATRLASRNIDVHLLEAGGLTFEERSQSLYKARMAADNHRGTNEGRFRTFGGSSTQWGGQVLPFTPDIFQPISGSSALHWPIEEQEVSSYYKDVEDVLGVDHLPYSSDLLEALNFPALPRSSDVDVRFAKWAPFHRRNLAQTLGAEALRHANLTVFSHANAVSVSASSVDACVVTSVRVVSYSRREFTFEATHFVLCAGTVESSRLLLLSPDIPNPHDQIGRYLHDHVAYHAAEFVSPARERAVELLGPFYVNGTIHSCKLEASAETRRREDLLAVMAHVVILEPDDSGTNALRNLLRSLQSGKIVEALGTNALPFVCGIGDIVRLFVSSKFRQRRAVSKRAKLLLNIDVEQAPEAENRVLLSSSEVDAFGLPVTVIHWTVGQTERDTARRYAALVRRYLTDLMIDPGQWGETLKSGTEPVLLDTNHAMGGLCLGNDPKTSVVDRDLTMHGVSNLSIASCAVFPSGSSSNPTFTMMALTLRLADFLTSKLARS